MWVLKNALGLLSHFIEKWKQKMEYIQHLAGCGIAKENLTEKKT